MYRVGKVKTFEGRQGIGYSCELLCNGVKVADVLEEARGGELRLQFYDTGRTIGKYLTYDGKVSTKPMSPNEAAFAAYCIKQKQGAYELIENLVNEYEAAKRVARQLKSKVIYQRTDGKFYASKATTSAALLRQAIDIIAARADTKVVLNNIDPVEAVRLMAGKS